MENFHTKMRELPSIDRLLAVVQDEPEWRWLPHSLIIDIMREVVAAVRSKLKAGQDADLTIAALIEQARLRLEIVMKPGLRRVINATGVVLHTNLGRAPLSCRATKAVEAVMNGYCTLEYNVATGERGSRYNYVIGRICAITGCEDALVVNNNAAAVLLVLSTLANNREVIVCRGELVEIGGSFRVPDVMKQSGAKLVEVGTTNKTHLSDYQAAINANTAAILKVHTSNYRIVGFTEKPEDKALVNLAKEYGIPIIEDLGSGTILSACTGGWQEPSVAQRLLAGIDVVTFSGDKLLGAGQSGIIAGKKIYIEKMKKHPLLRAIRVDKLTLAALEGTLLDYQVGNPAKDVPVQRMLQVSEEELKSQAEKLVQRLESLTSHGWQSEVIALQSQAGGGALPGISLPSFGVGLKVEGKSVAEIEKQFRHWQIPIIVRIQNNQVIIDMRCLLNTDMVELESACRTIAKGASK